MSQPLFKNLEIAESALRKDNRYVLEVLNKGWVTYEQYADDNYIKAINNTVQVLHDAVDDRALYIHTTDKLVELAWEMTSALKILSLGLKLVPHKDKPTIKNNTNLDHLVMVDDHRIWIECVTPSRGKGDFPDSEAEGAFTVPEEEMKLRLVNSLDQKAGPDREGRTEESQVRKFFRTNPDFANDSCIVAINTANLRFDSSDMNGISLPCQALFGFGPEQWTCPKTGRNATNVGFIHTPTETNRNGKQISMELFKTNELECLSGVLYSISSPFGRLGDPYEFVANPCARNALPVCELHNLTVWEFDQMKNILIKKAANKHTVPSSPSYL